MLQFEFKNESETVGRLNRLQAFLDLPSQSHLVEFAILRLAAAIEGGKHYREPSIGSLRDLGVSLRQVANMIDAIAISEDRLADLLNFEQRTGSWQDAMDSGT